MLQAKTKRLGSVFAMLLLSVALFAPTFTAHIYASGNDNTVHAEGANAQAAQAIEVEVKNVTEEVVIENSAMEIPADDMYEGESLVTVNGQNGLVRKQYTERYENGVLVSKVLVSEEMVTAPVDSIAYVGTKKKDIFAMRATGEGKPKNYKRYIDVSASAYDLSFASCGKRPGDRGYGITASGMQAQVGVVAVDPRVIPLGTKLYIEAIDGSWTYGYAIAGDTGGAIKGNRVDLFYNTYNECIQFGRRNARVYILN